MDSNDLEGTLLKLSMSTHHLEYFNASFGICIWIFQSFLWYSYKWAIKENA